MPSPSCSLSDKEIVMQAHSHHPMPIMAITAHRPLPPSLNRVAFSATVHCLTGCAIGEVLGMVIGTALGWGAGATIALAVAPRLPVRLRAHDAAPPAQRHGLRHRGRLGLRL